MTDLTQSTSLAVVRPPDAWLDRTLYPFATKRFTTSDGALSYVDEGSGPTLLFVHGTPSWSFEWREVIRVLSATHRCVAPDHLGFGLSDKPEGASLRPEDHARRLEALVTALDLRDVTLVVHDFGGPIGLPLALAPEGRVARLVVLNSWMWPSDGDKTIARIDRVVRSALGRFLYRWLGFSARVLLPGAFGDKRRLTKAVHRQYLGPLSSRRDREGTYALACALRGSDPHYAALWSERAKLARLQMTIVWGERDPALRKEYLARWIEAFPDARVVRVPDAGHFVAEERPDAVVAAVREAVRAPLTQRSPLLG
jgi:pimeloyl-ACP methyl ester carboxylesterase